MKITKKIFTGMLMSALLAGGAWGAGNGCDDVDKNEYITAELALCSTHAYNIGLTTNPESEAHRQMMRDVIALKTTIMTQQMYKQYEFLDATIRRMKTQLQKAVLTTKLQAAGAADSDSGASSSARYNSGDRTITVAGAQNCNLANTTADVFTCLRTNFNLITQQSNNGSNLTTDLKKQLANDFKLAMSNYNGADKDCKDGKGTHACCPIITVDNKDVDCREQSNVGSKQKFQNCMDALNSCIRKGYEAATQKQNQKKD